MNEPETGMESHGHWQDVYSNRDLEEVSWYQQRPQLSLRLIRCTGSGPDDPIIDVGGGGALLMGCLLDKGYRDLTVLDISSSALGHSRRRLGQRADQVQWIESDILVFKPPRQYRVWHDRALFHFMTRAQERRAYVDAMDSALKGGGQAIIATFATDGPRQCSGLDIVRYDAQSLMAELGPGHELLQTIDESHHTPKGKVQKFTYFRLRVR